MKAGIELERKCFASKDYIKSSFLLRLCLNNSCFNDLCFNCLKGVLE